MNFFKNRPLAFLSFVFLGVFFASMFIPLVFRIVICSVSLVLFILLFSKFRYTALFFAVIILSFVYGYLYYDVRIDTEMSYIGSNIEMTVEVTEISYQDSRTVYFDAVDTGDCDINKINLSLSEPKQKISEGDILNIRAEIQEIVNEDGFESIMYNRSKGIYVKGQVVNYDVIGHREHIFKDIILSVQSYFRNTYYDNTDEKTASFLCALSIGDKSGLDKSIRRDYSRIGTAHMLAISGMHLAVIIGIVTYILRVVKVSRRLRAFISSIVCLCFIFIAGASLSVIRAGVMFIFFCIADAFGRKSDSVTNLLFGVALIVLFSPSTVFDLGLILSFTSTLGIVVIVGPYMKRTNTGNKKGILYILKRIVAVPVITALSAMSFSFIPILICFEDISLLSVIANLLLAPFITVLLVLSIVLICVSALPIFPMITGTCAAVIFDIADSLTSLLSSLPYASVRMNHPFVRWTFIAIIIGTVLIFFVKRLNGYMLPYLCWFVTFVFMFLGFNVGYADSCDVVFSSFAGSDALLMRNGDGAVLLDLGREYKSAHDRAFDAMNSELYINEIDYWIFAGYGDKTVYSVSEFLNESYVRNICIPVPDDDVDRILCEEIESMAHEEGVNVIYFKYGVSFECNSNIIKLYNPVQINRKGALIYSADIYINDKLVSYFGRGYFEYSDVSRSCDYLFIGECGSKAKQHNAGDIDFEFAVISEGNEIASSELNGNITLLDDKQRLYKTRIG